mmetsp:Transcript_15270/g.38841  ORF Transcript_15270/g.38841 Transcript_15270/m.38841 type:complete len:204 (+) Transcript_15270:217-828(+)
MAWRASTLTPDHTPASVPRSWFFGRLMAARRNICSMPSWEYSSLLMVLITASHCVGSLILSPRPVSGMRADVTLSSAPARHTASAESTPWCSRGSANGRRGEAHALICHSGREPCRRGAGLRERDPGRARATPTLQFDSSPLQLLFVLGVGLAPGQRRPHGRREGRLSKCREERCPPRDEEGGPADPEGLLCCRPRGGRCGHA